MIRHFTVSRDELRDQSSSNHKYSVAENISIDSLDSQINKCEYKDIEGVETNKYHFSTPFVAELDYGLILSGNGISTTKNYNVILDSDKSIQTRVNRKVSAVSLITSKVLKKCESNNASDIDMAVPFTSGVDSEQNVFPNYYVWVHNYLTQIEGIMNYKKKTGATPAIVLPNDPPTYVTESLKYFGLEDSIVYWDQSDTVKIENLLIPSNRRIEQKSIYQSDHKFLSPSACRWLRSKAIEQSTVNNDRFSDRIFISREDAGTREIENRESLISELRKHGFSTYILEDLSFKEQVSLFLQADVIVGAHGAGLVNILFSSDSTVIELFGDMYIPTYYLLSQSCEHTYYAISGESVGQHSVPIRYQDIKINPQSVIEYINN
jgi:hypothetical protein